MKVMVLAHPSSKLHGGGGAEKVMATLTFALDKQIEFVFVYPQTNIIGNLDFPRNGKCIQLDVWWNEPTGNLFHRIQKLYHRMKTLRAIIREEKPDIILSNSIFVWHHLLTGLRMTRFAKNVILRFGNPIEVELKRRKSLYSSFMKLGLNRIDRVLASSEGVADGIVKSLGVNRSKITVIHNPIPTEEIKALIHEPISDLLLENDNLIVLNVARLVYQKNHTLLIRAFHQARLTYPQAHLVIVGAGDQKYKLEKLVEKVGLTECVHFVGWQANPFKYMQTADIFINSSDHEGFCNVIVEAMVCGCPVIATDCPYGPSEILDEGKYGILVPVGDEKRLTEQLIKLLGDEALRQELAQKGRERAKNFDVKTQAAKYAALFHQLAG